jgi:hypothetical protein
MPSAPTTYHINYIYWILDQFICCVADVFVRVL